MTVATVRIDANT